MSEYHIIIGIGVILIAIGTVTVIKATSDLCKEPRTIETIVLDENGMVLERHWRLSNTPSVKAESYWRG